MKREIYLVGGGGHCLSAIDVIDQLDLYEIKGVFDLKRNIGKKILNYEVIDQDENIYKYVSNDSYFIVTAGQIKSPDLRENLYNLLKQSKANMATIISPFAYVSKNSFIGEGSFVGHHALVNADVNIGKNNIINTKSLLEHSVVVGDHCHISTGAVVNGDCIVNSRTFVGSNSVLEQGYKTKEKDILSAGKFHRKIK